MAEHCGYIVQIKELRKHTNADRLQIATIFGNDVVVGLETKVGDVGVYFPTDLQLSERFCQVNDLVRRKDENGNQAGGFLDPDKRNIKAIKLRGERSDGLFMPIVSLADFCTISDLKIGDKIDTVNGEEICRKYIPRRNPYSYTRGGNRPHKAKVNYAPNFAEHVETEQLAYNLDKFKAGDIIQITCKLHGTSQRMGNVPLLHTRRTWLDKLFRRHGKDYYEYGDVVGTRRVVLDGKHQGGYYEKDDWRYAIADKVAGKLHRGEILYGEVVGFQGPNGAPIMGIADNKKINDPDFVKKYGDKTVFSYGCTQENSYDDESPCCKFYAYRMVLTSEDGFSVDYSPEQLKIRCEQLGIDVVPEFETFIIPDYVTLPDDVGSPSAVNPGEYVLRMAEQYFDGPDPICPDHVREGVVIRILNRNGFAVYKHKNFSFKCLSGVISEQFDKATGDQQIENDILEEL